MANNHETHEVAAPDPARVRRARTPERGDGEDADGAGVTDEIDDATLRDRIVELEAELAAARKTITVLLDKAERRAGSAASSAAMFDAAVRMEQIIAKRTREVEEKRAALAAVNEQLREVTSNFDQIVRQRTRALAESEEQLRRKNRELERLNEMKAEFISIAAHELRTPLTSIVGYLDLVTEGRFGELPPKMQRPMTSLGRNAHRLTRLVEEMLDVSRIESGKVTLYRTPCKLGEIVMHAISEYEDLAEAEEKTLTSEIDAEPRIDADAEKIHQVVASLLASAIRHTPESGTITAMVDYAPQDRFAGAWARLRVKNTGSGIPSHLQSRIFEPFYDVHTAKHHTSAGPDSAGLGLYIARGLVDLHGGLITVTSKEGAYTEFTVLLPLAEKQTD